MIRIGAAVAIIEDAQDINEAVLKNGAGGTCRGEVLVNGMKELRLGNNRELGIR